VNRSGDRRGLESRWCAQAHGRRERPPSANMEGRPNGVRHRLESDRAALLLRIETAAFLHCGELTGRAAGARSKRDGWRKPLGIKTSALRQFSRDTGCTCAPPRSLSPAPMTRDDGAVTRPRTWLITTKRPFKSDSRNQHGKGP